MKKRILEILIALFIPVFYFFILSSSKDPGTKTVAPVTPQPMADITGMITEGKYSGWLDKFKKPDAEEINAFMQSRIYRLEQGERQVFEAETGFKHIHGNIKNDSSRTVLFPRGMSFNGTGCICSGLAEKITVKSGSQKYLKPVMRISKKDFRQTDMTPVIAVVVNNASGKTVDSVIIRISSFCDKMGNYDGDYIDEFTFEVSIGSLSIKNRESGIANDKFDFKIYWYGLVDLWLDKVIVDDEKANRLLNSGSYSNYDAHIIDETTPEMFLITALKLKNGDFTEANYPCVNHVMNVMYNHLQNCSVPISLQTR